ncbi:peptide ABC transporter substrate-binding protein [Bacillus thuringiensis]|uniref:peptide ABC transporter substrate-binding protein n=1 Tax=Bacillus thuringiensis TaxID=1428 RepID=UPI003B986A35
MNRVNLLFKKRLRWTYFLCCCLLLLVACSETNDKKSTNNLKQVLHLVSSADNTALDIALPNDNPIDHTYHSGTIHTQVNEGLFRLSKDGKSYEPALAENVEISNDQKTYTFTIRKNAKWSDGQAITARDFEYGWKRTIDPKLQSKYTFPFAEANIENAADIIAGKKNPEQLGVFVQNNKLIVKLSNHTPYLKTMLSFPSLFPQRKDIIEKYGASYAKNPQNMVYSGPFTLTAWDPKKGWTFAKNEQYWNKEQVQLEKIHVQVLKNPLQALALYKAGKLDRLVLPMDSDFSKIKKAENIVKYNEPTIEFLRLNQKNTLLNNRNIRESLAMAINKDNLTRALGPQFRTLNHIVPDDLVTDEKGVDYTNKIPPIHSFNPETANNKFKQGVSELGVSEKQTIELLINNTSKNQQAGNLIKEQLERSIPNLTIHLKEMPLLDKIKLEQQGNYDLSLALWGADTTDPATFLNLWREKNPYNMQGYKNEEVEKLIDEGQQALTLAQRLEKFSQAEILYLQDVVIVPLYQHEVYELQNPTIKNFQRTKSLGSEYQLKYTYMFTK